MIHLITGLPGSGKSLRTVHYIHQFVQEGRPVYACGVDGLNVPGVMPLDNPNDWEQFPDGSVFIIDEAQKVWPSRRGAEPIPPVRALSEHRHHGMDFVLITQHPAMIDSYVRRLVGRHEHLVRKFNMQAATVFCWNEVQDDPSQNSARELAEEALWAYPKHLYSLYKSATIHTMKRRIPKALIVIAAAAILIPALAWSAYSTITGWSEEPEQAAPEADSPGLPGLSAQAAPAAEAAPLLDYVALYRPRIPGVMWSAPAYDGFEVKDYPRPHCIIAGDQRVERITCTCYTQQVTPMEMPDRMCIAIARNGVWDPRRPPMESRPSEASRAGDEPPPLQEQEALSPVGMGAGIDRSVQQTYTPPDFLPR
jgi:zona occludens toxin